MDTAQRSFTFMRNVLLSASVLTALALVGCGDDTRPASTGVAIDGFCDDFVDAICDDVAACSCGATADADCRSELATNCGGASGVLSPAVRARVTAGTVVYDANAAGALLAQLRAEASCDNPIIAVGWDVTEALSFGGVLSGTLAPGASCVGGGDSPFGSACAEGLCTNVDGAARCIGLAGLGEPCGMGIDSVCLDLNAPFATLVGGDLSLRCNIASGATTGTCAALLADGATCAGPDECASDRCEATVCAPPLANGADCFVGSECSSGFCSGSGASAVCAAAATVNNGGACMDDNECVSGACQRDVCVEALCATVGSEPPTP